MAASENDILRDEQERSNLLRAIADVETAIAVSTPGTRRVLENTVDNARKRITTLDKKIEDGKVERAEELQAQTVAAALAEKEAKLNASEKKTYEGFLNEAFFTKKDFGKLNEFYAHSWDRLSDGGKDEMSHRVWEGIRRDEYRFSDLPKDVQTNEAKRLYTKLTSPTIDQGSLVKIPEADRADFIDAYEAGNRKQIADVLARRSFHENVGLEKVTTTKHNAINAGKSADDSTVLTRNNPSVTDKTPEDVLTAAAGKFDSISLKGVTLVETSSVASTAAIPDASSTRVNVRSPA